MIKLLQKKFRKRYIGLTGGIATGKTTVSQYLAETYQLPILDADLYARQAVSPGTVVLDQIIHRYGEKIRLEDGNLDRPQLGKIIFENFQERQWLESQIHPYVRECFQQDLGGLDSPVVLVIPLLFEAKMTDLCTEIWVVSVTPEIQLRRLMERDQLSEEGAIQRINCQMSLAEKCQLADIVLDNSSSREFLLEQVDRALISSSLFS